MADEVLAAATSRLDAMGDWPADDGGAGPVERPPMATVLAAAA